MVTGGSRYGEGRWLPVRALISWIVKYGDESVAILLILIMVVLAWADVVGQTYISNTILLVLAAITAGNLRDRFAAESMRRDLQAALSEHSDRLWGALAQSAEIQVLTGAQVGAELAAAREGTGFWRFRGGTGTFLRAVTLPECVRDARSSRRRLTVRIEIIDPCNPELCARYANFRNTLTTHPDAGGEEWTEERTRKEAYSTILAACWYQRRYALLDIAVSVSERMTTFRWDMSSRAVLLTQEDAAGQALLFTADKTYYRYWDVELGFSFAQARSVPLAAAAQVPLGEEPSVDEVISMFEALECPLPRSYEPRDVSDIIAKALQARNPYES